MKQEAYDPPWRPIHEITATIGWGSAGIGSLIGGVVTGMPLGPYATMAGISAAMAVIRGRQAKKLIDFRIGLCGKAFEHVHSKKVDELHRKHPDDLWIGKGFEWKPVHTQRADEARSLDISAFYPPKFLRRWLKAPDVERTRGMPWIHGLEPVERDIRIPMQSIEGNNVVFGTTGAGKTRFLEHLVYQAVRRNEPVVIIDPKGDQELRDIAKKACASVGRPDAFLLFHLAFPNESIRIDPMKNWSRVTEVASRLSGVDPGDNDSFKKFGWLAMNIVASSLVYLGIRPNIKRIQQYVRGGTDALMEEVLKKFLSEWNKDWNSYVQQRIQKMREKKEKESRPNPMSAECMAYIDFYRNEVPREQRSEVVDELLTITEHSRDHYGKMILPTLPMLAMLNYGEVGELLSPDETDVNDTRPIYDFEKIIKNNCVLFIGLDALSDVQVAGAIGSILLADLAAVAGATYNYGEKKRVNLFVDESSEVVNGPMVQILNKARGAGFVSWLFAQNYPDFVHRLGSEPFARMVLGNCNNLFALRLKDQETIQYVTEQFSEIEIQQLTKSVGYGAESESIGLDFRSTATTSLGKKSAEVFPSDLLTKLPDLQFIASVAGGRLYKGRIQKLVLN